MLSYLRLFVIMFKTFDVMFKTFCFLAPKDLYIFCLSNILTLRYLMKGPETRRGHWIWNLRLYLTCKDIFLVMTIFVMSTHHLWFTENSNPHFLERHWSLLKDFYCLIHIILSFCYSLQQYNFFSFEQRIAYFDILSGFTIIVLYELSCPRPARTWYCFAWVS